LAYFTAAPEAPPAAIEVAGTMAAAKRERTETAIAVLLMRINISFGRK